MLLPDDSRIVRLLKFAPFEHRDGAWRFGTKRISDHIVERLVAAGAGLELAGEALQ
jgi:hypothetical protein